MPARRTVSALTTAQVLDLCNIAPSTLEYWVRNDLVSPSVLGGEGHRYQRYWSVEDAVMVRTIKALRDAGCPLQRVRAARAYIDRLGRRSREKAVLVWTGDDVVLQLTWGDLVSAVKHPGQSMLLVAALPVQEWISAIRQASEPIDIAKVRQERKISKRRRTGRTPTVHVVSTRRRA